MNITDVLKSQHETILQLLLQIEQNLHPEALDQKADEVRESLALLTRRLTIHLAMEDKALYPLLISGQDENVRRTTIKFMTEMGGLIDLFKTYAAKWNTTEQIRKKPVEFCEESENIFLFLRNRIRREEAELHPLVGAI